MKLVEDQKLQPACLLDDLRVRRCVPRQHQFEHHVVREKYVGRVRDERLTLFLIFLASVAFETDRLGAFWVAVAQVLF